MIDEKVTLPKSKIHRFSMACRNRWMVTDLIARHERGKKDGHVNTWIVVGFLVYFFPFFPLIFHSYITFTIWTFAFLLQFFPKGGASETSKVLRPEKTRKKWEARFRRPVNLFIKWKSNYIFCTLSLMW